MKRSRKIVAAAMISLGSFMAQAASQNGVVPMNCNRDAVLKFFEENVYGVRPKFEGFIPKAKVVKEEHIAEVGALRKTVAINTMTPIGEKAFKATAYFPEGEGAVPVFVMPGFPQSIREFDLAWKGKMPRWPVNDIVARGCGTVSFDYNDVLKDDAHVFDGVERRELKPQEIQQIAGRAGRYGMYSKGFVGAVYDLDPIREGLRTPVPQIQEAVLGFSDTLLQSRFDLLEVLSEWAGIPAAEPYKKLDISRYIWIISTMRQRGFSLTKEEELQAANIPFDETDSVLEELFFVYLRCYAQGEPISQPRLEGPDRTLPELESYCRKLDLYFSFAKTFRYPVDTEKLREARDKAAEDINEILIYRLQNNIRFCEICGKPLPLHAKGKTCDSCRRRLRTK